MRHPKTALTLFSFLALTLPTTAQEDLGSARVHFEGAPIYATLALDSGRIATSATPLPGQTSVQRGTPCFENNVDVDNIRDGLLLSANDEIFDWGSKSCSGSSLVRSVTIGYGSQSVPTSVRNNHTSTFY